jgi:hypothetical protein
MTPPNPCAIPIRISRNPGKVIARVGTIHSGPAPNSPKLPKENDPTLGSYGTEMS